MKLLDVVTQIKLSLTPKINDPLMRAQYAWWLLEHLTHNKKSELLGHKELSLSYAQKEKIDLWVDQIVHEVKPIAYILGTVPFGPLDINVKPPVLIPRMETEEWVMRLSEQLQQKTSKPLKILDLCSGSGCIAALIAHMLPTAHIWAIDICPDAIALTKENIQKYNLSQVTVIQSDLFEQIPNKKTFDLIVTNPPYISEKEYAELDASVTNWEHKHALTAEDEGLQIIKKIITQAPNYLHPNKELANADINQLYIEIGWRQGKAVAQLMKQAGWQNVVVSKDSAEKERVVSGSISNVAKAPNK